MPILATLLARCLLHVASQVLSCGFWYLLGSVLSSEFQAFIPPRTVFHSCFRLLQNPKPENSHFGVVVAAGSAVNLIVIGTVLRACPNFYSRSADLGALIVAYTILGAPYCQYRIIYPKTPRILIIKAPLPPYGDPGSETFIPSAAQGGKGWMKQQGRPNRPLLPCRHYESLVCTCICVQMNKQYIYVKYACVYACR